MTVSFIVGPIVALVVFIILVTDKWETVLKGTREAVHKTIYEQYQILQKQNIRCKVISIQEHEQLQLVIYGKDFEKAKSLLQKCKRIHKDTC